MITIAKFEKVSFNQWRENSSYLPEEETKRQYDNITMPARATKGSAGYDFFSPFSFTLEPNGTILIPTGIRCKIDEGYVLLIYPRSGLGFKYGIRLMNTVGVIDSDYYNADNEGHIAIKLYNPSIYPITINQGEALAQGIFTPFFLAEENEVIAKRTGGFGSTDNKKRDD